MNSLSVPHTIPGWGQLARRALAWWIAELAGMAPDSLRAWIAERRGEAFRLYVGDHMVSLHTPASAGGQSAVIPLERDGAPKAWIKRRFAGAAGQAVLDPSVVLRCELTFPAAAEANLPQIIKHQLERLVPLRPEEVSFVWEVMDRASATSPLKVAVSLVKSTTIERARKMADEIGLRLRAIVIKSTDGKLLPIWHANVRWSSGTEQRLISQAFRLLEIGLFAMAYIIFVYRLDARRNTLIAQLGALQSAAPAVQLLVTQVNQREDELAAVRARVSQPAPLAVLDELTRRLPLNAFLSEIDFKPDAVELIGTAAHATTLLPIFDQQGCFSSARFVAPITSVPSGQGEHFELSIDLLAHQP